MKVKGCPIVNRAAFFIQFFIVFINNGRCMVILFIEDQTRPAYALSISVSQVSKPMRFYKNFVNNKNLSYNLDSTSDRIPYGSVMGLSPFAV